MQACGLDGGSGISALALVLEVDLSLTIARHDTGDTDPAKLPAILRGGPEVPIDRAGFAAVQAVAVALQKLVEFRGVEPGRWRLDPEALVLLEELPGHRFGRFKGRGSDMPEREQAAKRRESRCQAPEGLDVDQGSSEM